MASISCKEEGGGYIWRKYGEKTVGVRKRVIKRSYFRCACFHANTQCSAKKRVDRLEGASRGEEPLKVYYINQHNHSPDEGVPELDARKDFTAEAFNGKATAGGVLQSALQGLENLRPEDLAKEMYQDLLVQMRSGSPASTSNGFGPGEQHGDAGGPVEMDLDDPWEDDIEDPLSSEADALLSEIFGVPLAQGPGAAALGPVDHSNGVRAAGPVGHLNGVRSAEAALASVSGAASKRDCPEDCRAQQQVMDGAATTRGAVAAPWFGGCGEWGGRSMHTTEGGGFTSMSSLCQVPHALGMKGYEVAGAGVMKRDGRAFMGTLYREGPCLNTAGSSTKDKIAAALEGSKHTTTEEDCLMAAGAEKKSMRAYNPPCSKLPEPTGGAPPAWYLPTATQYCGNVVGSEARFCMEEQGSQSRHGAAGALCSLGEDSSMESRYSVEDSCELPAMDFPQWDFDALPSTLVDPCTMYAG